MSSDEPNPVSAKRRSLSPDANPSYKRTKPFVLTDEMRKQIAEAVASVDHERIAYWKTLTLPERVRIVAEMIRVEEEEAVKQLRELEPELSEREALFKVRGGWLKEQKSKRNL